MELLKAHIRDVPDFPKPGILFKDITPLLQDPQAFQLAIEEMARRVESYKVDRVVAIESRGFIFGSAIAFKLGAGLSLVRKPRKLPYQTRRVDYALEYGQDSLEMHIDAVRSHDNVIVVDDVLATGGTAAATAKLVEEVGAKVKAFCFLSELDFLKGREKLQGYPIYALVKF